MKQGHMDERRRKRDGRDDASAAVPGFGSRAH